MYCSSKRDILYTSYGYNSYHSRVLGYWVCFAVSKVYMYISTANLQLSIFWQDDRNLWILAYLCMQPWQGRFQVSIKKGGRGCNGWSRICGRKCGCSKYVGKSKVAAAFAALAQHSPVNFYKMNALRRVFRHSGPIHTPTCLHMCMHLGHFS